MLDLLLLACERILVQLVNHIIHIFVQILQFLIWFVFHLTITWIMVPISILLEKCLALILYLLLNSIMITTSVISIISNFIVDILTSLVLVICSILSLLFKFVLDIFSIVFGLLGQIISLICLSFSSGTTNNNNYNLRTQRTHNPTSNNSINNQRTTEPMISRSGTGNHFGQGQVPSVTVTTRPLTSISLPPRPSAPSFAIINNKNSSNSESSSNSSNQSIKKTLEKNVNSIEECPICLEEFSEIKRHGKLLVSLECGHILCRECAESRIIGTEKLCPTCRTPIIQKPRVLYI